MLNPNKQNNQNPIKRTLADIFITLILFWGIYCVYTEFDPSEIRDFGIFPWDANKYYKIAVQFKSGSFHELSGAHPFATRLLYPFFLATCSNLLGVTLMEAALVINTTSAFIVTIFTFLFLQANKISRRQAFLVTTLFCLFWLGPLRYTLFNPGGSFAFDTVLVCLLYLILNKLESQTSPFAIALASIIVCMLTLGREFIFHICILALLYKIALVLKPKSNTNLMDKSFRQKFVVSFFTTFGAFVGYCIPKFIVNDTGSGYSIFETVLTFGWFHLNIGETLYVFFYALGAFFLVFCLTVIFANSRSIFMQQLKNTIKRDPHLIIFIFAGVIFSLVGGSDSDRLILWFLPFFALIGTIALNSLSTAFPTRKNFLVAVFILLSALWSRFYVPAVPNLFFVGDLYNSAGGVRSNLDSQKFYGLQALERFRKPIIELENIQIPYDVVSILHEKSYQNQRFFINETIASTPSERIKGSPYKGSYQLEINNIPFPLGFAHNQYEFLAAHPYYGDLRIRSMLTAQWILLLVLVGLSLRSSSNMQQI